MEHGHESAALEIPRPPLQGEADRDAEDRRKKIRTGNKPVTLVRRKDFRTEEKEDLVRYIHGRGPDF
jgi:hypothetical protein